MFAGVEIIAEPGRYFAEAPFSLGCMVFGEREGRTPAGKPCFDYWITDGLYGAMNSLLYDHATLSVAPLGQPSWHAQGEIHLGTMSDEAHPVSNAAVLSCILFKFVCQRSVPSPAWHCLAFHYNSQAFKNCQALEDCAGRDEPALFWALSLAIT